jgi:CheY-like chemotaxis protein
VYGIVKQHDGAIAVTSAPEKGATFTIYLPLAEGDSAESAAQNYAPPAGGDECILLVEDNSELRVALAESLAELGYAIVAAGDASTALVLAEEAAQAKRTIDLVVTDLVLPGISGPELYAALKPLYPHAKLLVMTGHPITQIRMAELQQVEHWLQKPFVLNSLAQKVRQILGGGQ